ncbi:hypothetical protein DFH08DRAFT_803278 [Mycena albidolilacea]|uniref:Cytochrome P450 n=1 Tax=Mycena albidolilacea TaxID=1033008 RepID=A0AAD7EWI3_9AGAR|nr:hypothetical protein DFH08DRAFT_803278 [Mycena albidolilacea]
MDPKDLLSAPSPSSAEMVSTQSPIAIFACLPVRHQMNQYPSEYPRMIGFGDEMRWVWVGGCSGGGRGGRVREGSGIRQVVHKPHMAFGNCAKPQAFSKLIQERSSFQLWDGCPACHWVCGCCGINVETRMDGTFKIVFMQEHLRSEKNHAWCQTESLLRDKRGDRNRARLRIEPPTIFTRWLASISGEPVSIVPEFGNCDADREPSRGLAIHDTEARYYESGGTGVYMNSIGFSLICGSSYSKRELCERWEEGDKLQGDETKECQMKAVDFFEETGDKGCPRRRSMMNMPRCIWKELEANQQPKAVREIITLSLERDSCTVHGSDSLLALRGMDLTCAAALEDLPRIQVLCTRNTCDHHRIGWQTPNRWIEIPVPPPNLPTLRDVGTKGVKKGVWKGDRDGTQMKGGEGGGLHEKRVHANSIQDQPTSHRLEFGAQGFDSLRLDLEAAILEAGTFLPDSYPTPSPAYSAPGFLFYEKSKKRKKGSEKDPKKTRKKPKGQEGRSRFFRFLASVYVVEMDLDDIGCVNTSVPKQSSNGFGLEQDDKGNASEEGERTSAEGMQSPRETRHFQQRDLYALVSWLHHRVLPASSFDEHPHYTHPCSHMRTAAHPCSERQSELVARPQVSHRQERTWCEIRWMDAPLRAESAFWQGNAVVISDSSAVKHIFRQMYTYVKSPALRPLITKFVGNGVAWAEGDDHRFQRRMISPAFSASAVKKMVPCMLTCVDRLIVRLQNDCKTRGVLNMCNYIPGVILDIIGRVDFGYEFGPDSPECIAILGAWQTGVTQYEKKLIYQVGQKMLQEPPNVDGTDLFSILVRESWEGKRKHYIQALPRPMLRLRHLGSARWTQDSIATPRLSATYGGAGQQAAPINGLNAVKPDGERKLDDTTLLENASGISSQKLIMEILTFFMVGFETTSGTIHLILHDRAQHPHVQTRLREELLAADSAEVETIEALPYLDAVTREGLCLHPSVCKMHHVAAHDDILPLKDPITLSNGEVIMSLPVKAGDRFIIPFMGLNTNLNIWGPNAVQFIQERWLVGGSNLDIEELPRGPWGNVSNFADQPGIIFAELGTAAVKEIKLIVSALVKHFELKDTGVKVKKYLARAMQSFVDGKAVYLPLELIPLQHYI